MEDGPIGCRYHMFGCEVKPLENERLAHQEMCVYRYCGCPFPVKKCKWQGRIMEAVEHLKICHQMRVLEGETVKLAIPNIYSPTDLHWGVLQSCFDNHFIVILTKRYTLQSIMRFYVVVKLLGSRNKTGGFGCRMELVRPGKMLVWEGKPLSLFDEDGVHDLTNDCLIFNYPTAVLFTLNQTLKLKVTVTLSE